MAITAGPFLYGTAAYSECRVFILHAKWFIIVHMNGGVMVRVLADSSCEEVLGWKCCNIQDMNIEIHVINTGEIELEGNGGRDRVNYLYPPGVHALGPGQEMAFYLNYDEDRFKSCSHIIIIGDEGEKYRAAITGDREEARVVIEEFRECDCGQVTHRGE